MTAEGEERTLLSPRVVRRCRRLARWAAACSLAIAVIVLVGWSVGSSRVTSLLPSFPAMMPPTAAMIAFGASSLAALTVDVRHRALCWFGRVAAAALGALAMTTIAEYALGRDLGVDTLLFEEQTCNEAPLCGRAALHSAVAGALLSASELAGTSRSYRARRFAHDAALALVFGALVVLAGHVYGAEPLYGVPRDLPHTGMSVFTATSFLLLGVGVLLAKAADGVTGKVMSARFSGAVARRFLIAVLAVPVVAVLLLVGDEAGLYPPSLARATLAVLFLFVAVALVVSTAGWIDRAEAARGRLAAIVASSDDGVISATASGTILTWNAAAERIYGYSAEEAVGKPGFLEKIVPPDKRAELDDIMACVKRGEGVTGLETVRVRKDGTRIDVSLTVSPLEGTHGREVSVITRDVTSRKRLERELERMREEWASVIGHELRQPLSTIEMSGGILEQVAPTSPLHGKAVAHLRTATKRLDRMIGDLADASKLEAHRLTLAFEDVDLEALVHDVVARMPAVDGREVRVRVSGEPRAVHVDPVRVEQVLGNLLTNATKYGFAQTPIDVALTYADDEVAVSVTNRGEGLSKEEIERLFVRFTRTERARRSPAQGLGLGLYIVRGLVEAHGGRIGVESAPGGETTFRFTLPVARALPPHAA